MEKSGKDTGNKLLFGFQQHDTEWVCTLKATQLLFLFSRDDVCLFYTMLQNAVSKLKLLNPVPLEGNGYESAEKTLQKKIHFMPLSTHLQFPAAIEFSEHSLDLTGDELTDLVIQVMFLVQDLEMDEAEWCFASHSSNVGFCHLVRQEERNCRGPVLCGCLPPASKSNHVKGWMLLPFIGSFEEKKLCPICLGFWKMEQLRVPPPSEQSASIEDDR